MGMLLELEHVQDIAKWVKIRIERRENYGMGHAVYKTMGSSG